jgi:hypothetical protein
MDPHDLTPLGLDDDATRIVGAYLAELESHLPIGRRTRREVLAEIADGLACAVSDRVRDGQTPLRAAHAAVAEFGPASTVAAAFGAQLGPVVSHRLGLGLVLTGPLIGLTWVAATTSNGPDLQSRIASLLSAVPLLPLVLAVTVTAAVIAVTGAGWPARHLVATPARVVTNAARVAAVGCIAGDLILLSNAILGGAWPLHTPAVLVALAAGSSLTRLTLAALAAHRIARLRAVAN